MNQNHGDKSELYTYFQVTSLRFKSVKSISLEFTFDKDKLFEKMNHYHNTSDFCMYNKNDRNE